MTPRDRLRQAVDAERVAISAEVAASTAADRGRQAADAAAADAARYDDLDRQIAEYRAGLVKGGHAYVALPDDLAIARLRRRDAVDEAADTSDAARALAIELDDATRRRTEASSKAHAAMVAVVLAEAEAMATELATLEQQAAVLREQLTLVPSYRGATAPPTLYRMISEPPANALVSAWTTARSPQVSARWSNFATVLRADPDARFADVPMPTALPPPAFPKPPERMTLAR